MLALRILGGLAGTISLIVLGLAMSGVRVGALPRADFAPEGPLVPMAGSSATHHALTIDGEPTRESRCHAPALDPSTVLAHYEALAGDETRPRKLPYLLQEDPAGGGVLGWIAPDGSRRTVFVAHDPRGGTGYRLLEAGLPTDPDAPGARGRPLPGGVELPGAEVALSVVQRDGGGLCLFELPSTAEQAATRVGAALAERGLTIDREARDAMAEAGPSDGPRTLPLRDADGRARGLLVLTPSGGSTRVSLSVARAP